MPVKPLPTRRPAVRPSPAPRAKVESRNNVPAPKNTQRTNKDFDPEHLMSVFEERHAELNAAIEAGQDNENTTLKLAQSMMQAIVSSLPKFEKNLQNGTGRDAYAFVALCDMMLKLSNELRALQDRGAMSKTIMGEIIKPQLEALAHKITAGVNGAKLKLPKNIDRSVTDQLDGVKQTAVQAIGEVFQKTSGSLAAYFGGSENVRQKLDIDDDE